LTTGAHQVRTDAADANGVAFATTLQRSHDRKVAIFNGGPGHFRRYETSTDQFMLGGIATPYDGFLSIDRDGQHLALALGLYDASLTFVRRIESVYGDAQVVPAISISADGEYLYHGARGGIMRARVNDGRLVDWTANPVLGDVMRVAGDDSFVVTGSGFNTGALSLIRMR
jgi:hypothetical protein